MAVLGKVQEISLPAKWVDLSCLRMSRHGHFATFKSWNSRLESCPLEHDDKWLGPCGWGEQGKPDGANQRRTRART
jgi:hypothetical protein